MAFVVDGEDRLIPAFEVWHQFFCNYFIYLRISFFQHIFPRMNVILQIYQGTRSLLGEDGANEELHLSSSVNLPEISEAN